MISNSNPQAPLHGNLRFTTGAISPLEIPKILGRDFLDEVRAALHREYHPVGFTEIAIVNEVARRLASMELLEEAIGAIQREGARGLLSMLTSVANGQENFLHEKSLAGAMASNKLDECQRHSLGNSKAFFRALKELQNLQARRASSQLASIGQRFSSEQACEAHLRARFERGETTCRRCGKSGGCWIAKRRCYECRNCCTQTGLRHGTVMARSPLPLTTWFAAIGILLLRPTTSNRELATKLDLRRRATVRSMASKIRSAMGDEAVTQLLAGLNEVYK